jgi:hypothetical protein
VTSLQAIPRINPDFTVRDVGEEIIIISSKGDTLHTLDSVGAFIWRNIDGKRSVNDILEMLLESYDAVVATAERDMLLFFDELNQKNIVMMNV